jgi:hypothetical protein
MDRAIYRSLRNSSEEISNPRLQICRDDCRNARLILSRMEITRNLFIAFVTDFFMSVDFGYYVILLRGDSNKTYADLNRWRTELGLPMYFQKKAGIHTPESDFTAHISVLTGKKNDRIQTGEQFSSMVETELKKLGIGEFKFYACSFDSAESCAFDSTLKSARTGAKPGSDPLDFTLTSCISDITGQECDCRKLNTRNMRVRDILRMLLNSSTYNLGSWKNQNTMPSGIPLTLENIIRICWPQTKESIPLDRSSDKEKIMRNAVPSVCRSAAVLDLITKKGWTFIHSKNTDPYSKIISSPEIRAVLDFEPYTMDNINPLFIEELAVLSTGHSCENLIRFDKTVSKAFAESKALATASYFNGSEIISYDQDEITRIYSEHAYHAFFRIDLAAQYKNTRRNQKIFLSVLTDLEGDRFTKAREILSELKIDSQSISTEIRVEYNHETDYIKMAERLIYTGGVVCGFYFSAIYNELPELKNLHAFFTIVHWLSVLLDCREFTFGYDTPFSDEYITGLYSSVSGGKSEESIPQGLFFRGVNFEYVRVGSILHTYFMLKCSYDGAFRCVRILPGSEKT